MRRRIEHTVGGHETVEAAATDPMIDVPVLGRQVDEFDARPRGDEILVGGAAAVTAVMEPIGMDVGEEFAAHLAGVQVAAGHHPGVLAIGHVRRPHQPAHDQHVVGRRVAAVMMRGRPEPLAVAGREGVHRR